MPARTDVSDLNAAEQDTKDGANGAQIGVRGIDRSEQFDEVFALFKMFKYSREEGEKPLCECGIGAISDTYPHHRRFLFGGQQEDILEVLVFRHNHVLSADGVGPYREVSCKEQLDVLNMNSLMA